MMIRFNAAFAGLLSLSLLCIGAEAQVVNPAAGSMSSFHRPTVSPYLNLANRNQYGIASYHTIVRPMLEQQAAQERQQSTLREPPRQVRQTGSPRRSTAVQSLPQTGRYMNYSHFYAERKAK